VLISLPSPNAAQTSKFATPPRSTGFKLKFYQDRQKFCAIVASLLQG
jgi:hypothetical protein